MSEPIKITGVGEGPFPEWLTQIDRGLAEAMARGWRVKSPLVLEGDPYVFRGELRVSRVSFGEEDVPDDQLR